MFDRAGAERLLAPGSVVATGTACVVFLLSFFLSFFIFFFSFFFISFFVFVFVFSFSFFLLFFFVFSSVFFLRHQFINRLKVRPTMDIVFEMLDLYFGLL